MKIKILVIFFAIALISFYFFISNNKRFDVAKDINKIEFGTIFTDNMFLMEWILEKGWHNARIEKYHSLNFDPASSHMHYGCEIFEGMKAYKTNNNKVVLFRPKENFNRMNDSAKRMCMPEIDVEFVLKNLKMLVKKDERWVPQGKGMSLYIRPTMIANECNLNLKPANKFLFFIIMSPVGAIYKEGFNPVSILVSQKYTRASVGGVGNIKTGGNYAASMLAQKEAKEQGFSQVLWLDPLNRKYVEEVGIMNIFFVIDGVLVTPKLNGTILPGITRKSIITLAKNYGYKVQERKISIDEVIKEIKSGKCTEIFGSGTAAVISPVGRLKYNEAIFTINNNKTGPITEKLFQILTGIHHGTEKDLLNWIEEVN